MADQSPPPEPSTSAAASGRLTLLARLVRSPTLSALVLLVLTLAAFVPGLASVQTVDREEARYAIATQNMLATGDYLSAETDLGDIGPLYLGSHWLQALTVGAGGESAFSAIGAHRLPSLVLAVLAVFLLWWAARSFGDPAAAFLAAGLFAVTLLAALLARAASPDALILVLLVLGQAALARAWTEPGRSASLVLALAFWGAAILGVLAAGLLVPVILAASALILSAERRSTAWLRALAPFPGILAFLLFLLGWTATLWLDQGPAAAAIGLLGRLESFAPGGLPDALPPGTHLFFGMLSAFPALVIVLLALGWIFDRLRRPVVVFALAWALPVWIAAELAGDKAPTQIAPALPALALLAGAALADGGLARLSPVRTILASSLVTIPLGLLIAVFAASLAFGLHIPAVGIALQAASIVLGLLAFILWRRRAGGESIGLAAAGSSLLTGLAFFASLAPGLGGLRLSERALDLARASAACPEPQIVAGGYREPSLVFLAGPRTRSGGGSESADLLAAGGCAVAIVDRASIDTFLSRAVDLGLTVEAAGEVAGINVGNARPTELTIFTRTDLPASAQP
ncbi:MAG: glycosyltransferase family 39 protein [Bauldia sp.]|nr:glycosyltransferase family 39 protein [Bauldia sp.]